MTELNIAEYLRPGDRVLVGQGVAEPPLLVEKLIAAAGQIDRLTAFCGYSLSTAWATAPPQRPAITAYGVLGSLRKVHSGRLDIVAAHLSSIEDGIEHGYFPVDVVLIQVGPADADGFYDLGPSVDYGIVAAKRARVVLVEVNDRMPRTNSARRLHRSLVTAAIPASRPLLGSPARTPSPAEYAVAVKVATLVPDDAVIQLGAGAFAEAVAAHLQARRGLRVYTGLLGEWVVGLHRAKALAEGPAAVVTGVAVGGDDLYSYLDRNSAVEFATTKDITARIAAGLPGPFVAINSAVEVDVFGQLNAEFAGARYVGAVGGQVDYFRAAQRGSGGYSIAALAATTASGASRVVPRIDSAMVTSLKSDVDFVVTEWGVADLRVTSMSERVERMIEVAHPDHRDLLRGTVSSELAAH
ncbi:acetyl-CoA hydrolase/transferase family protein [Mycolicibacterium confluentis]|uniref:Acetyl-CoA hydrolase n=1 Tax=Mycolicibacterium confluentis TaxID=28047 RepID=A0A7I7Y3G2_9MYCO|nr:acetyl-CoA hydrolase/transferase C-terminal domain-containing protein [Mycolicibacterium confluentis]MCV7320591.1 methyltransferase [Mycolicibacterium confluentis]ORV30244.1 hypothetical protein AWB99_14165 [Mycolicibacterium confluentis]BBZ35633.1 acetyl-CoA hydrolase [Mycolicibacterium confluentis]